MAEDNDTRAGDTELRRAHVRKRAVLALHHLVEALASEDAGRLVVEVGEAGREIDRAEAELLRGPIE